MINPTENCGELAVQMNWQGHTRDVLIPYALSDGARSIADVNALMVMGMGEEYPNVAGRAVRTLGSCGLSAAALMLPFREFAPQELPWLVHEAVPKFAANLGGNPRTITGHSRGGGVALVTAGEAPELFSAVSALAPAALTNHHLGPTPEARRKMLSTELGIRNNFMQWPSRAGFLATRNADHELRLHRQRGGLRTAIDYALSDELGRFAAKGVSAMVGASKPAKIFVGRRDPFSRHEHIQSVLESLGCTDLLESVPGAHASMGSRSGRKQLHMMGKWIAKATGVAPKS